MGNDKFIVINDNVSWGIIKNELFVVNEENGKMYVFTGIHKNIWMTLGEMKRQEDFKYSCGKCSDEKNFLKYLLDLNLIHCINK